MYGLIASSTLAHGVSAARLSMNACIHASAALRAGANTSGEALGVSGVLGADVAGAGMGGVVGSMAGVLDGDAAGSGVGAVAHCLHTRTAAPATINARSVRAMMVGPRRGAGAHWWCVSVPTSSRSPSHLLGVMRVLPS